MTSASSDDTPDAGAAQAKASRKRFAFALAVLLVLLAAICIWQALRTRRQILKYSTPPLIEEDDGTTAAYPFIAEDLIEPFDPRPPTAQLADRVQTVSDRIAELQSAGQPDQARQLQERLDALLARRNGPYPTDGTPQLHVIGLYCGGAPWVRARGVSGRGVSTAHVKVTYQSAPLTLAFCAYYPVRWVVEADPGVEITKVVLGGHEQQRIDGLPDEIPVEGQVASEIDPRFSFYSQTRLEALPVATRLQELTELEPATFWTAGQFDGTPIVIGPGGDEWTAAMTLLALKPLYQEAVREARSKLAAELAAHTFTDVSCTVVNEPFYVAAANLAEHTIFGPYADTMQPLERGTTQLAIDPRGPKLYGSQRDQGIVVYDPMTGAAERLSLGAVTFRSHRDTYLAFDTRRNRMLAWDMNLLAIDPAKQAATLLREGNPAVRGLAYFADDDLLYACCASRERESVCNQVTIFDLCRFNEKGEEVSRTKLSLPIPGGAWDDGPPAIKMRFVSDKLLVSALGSPTCNGYVASETNYIIDRHTGKLLFACRRKPR